MNKYNKPINHVEKANYFWLYNGKIKYETKLV